MAESLRPFSCTHTPEVPDILHQLRCTLVLSTYQAGKVILLSPKDDGLVQLPRTFQKPMGLAVQNGRMAIAAQHEVVVLQNAPELASGYPKQPNTYDGFYVPRATYHTGELDLHDMAFGNEGLWAVNTRFSCLSIINNGWSFEPRWAPKFISDLTADDRCHLNGMAMVGGRPEWVTALGTSDTGGGWREHRLSGGVLVHVPSGEIVLNNLSMPHSPRVYDKKLYFLNSATGELMVADPEAGEAEVVNRVPGFARGMARCGDYLFIGISRIRKKHQFSDMPVARTSPFSGIVFVHLPSGNLAGSIQYLMSCEEIYDVQVIPGFVRPGILNHITETHRQCLSFPGRGLWARREEAENESHDKDGERKPSEKTKDVSAHTPEKGSFSPDQLKNIIAGVALAGSLLLTTPPRPAWAVQPLTEQVAAANPFNGIPVAVYDQWNSAPALVDIDNDGDLDVFIGTRGKNYASGYIRFFENTDTTAGKTSPTFVERTGPAGNPLYAAGFSGPAKYYFKPAFADIDGDGDQDAVIGRFDGVLSIWRNNDPSAAKDSPSFTQVVPSPFPAPTGGSAQYFSAPALVDIDGDGDLDAFAGVYSGRIRFFRNTGTPTSPAFTEQTGAANPLDSANFGGVNYDRGARPAFADYDGDGDFDAFVGTYGAVAFFENTGTPSAPVFLQRGANWNPFFGKVFPYTHTAPAVGDLDNDGDPDVFVGLDDGTLRYFTSNLPPLNDLDSPAPPTDPVSALFPLQDIYNAVAFGSQPVKRTGAFMGPPPGPIGPTGHTLNDIMLSSPVPDNISGATPDDVCRGFTVWALRTDGTWGPIVGTWDGPACPSPPLQWNGGG